MIRKWRSNKGCHKNLRRVHGTWRERGRKWLRRNDPRLPGVLMDKSIEKDSNVKPKQRGKQA